MSLQQPQMTPHPMQPVVYMNPGSFQPRLTKSYKFLRLVLIALGIMVVLNLNIFGNRLFGNGQLFSPLILLCALFGFISSKVSRVNGIPLAARFFGGAIVFFVIAGTLSKVANGMGSPVVLAANIVKDMASPVVFFATVLLAASMKKTGGEKGEGQILEIVFWLAFAGAVTVFIPLVFPQWHSLIRGENRSFSRFSGVYDNPNPASMAALTFMVCGLARTARSKKLFSLVLSLSVGTAAIMLTGSRAGILGAVFIVLPLGTLVFGTKQIIRATLGFAVIGIVGLGVVLAVQQQTDSKLQGQAKRAELLLNMANRGLDDETTGGRSTLAKIAYKMWIQSPFIGHGLGTSRGMLPYTELGPHNYYLTVLVESGVFGCTPFLVFWCFVGAKSFDRNNPNWIRILIIGVFLTISFYALTSHTIFNQRNQIFFIGVAMGLSINRKKNIR